MAHINTKLSCFIEQDEDDNSFIFIRLLDEKMFNMTLQFADITDELTDFIQINDHFELYNDISELISDLEDGNLQKFIGRPWINDRLNLLVNLRMKMKHQQSICDGSCILCNPDIGDDPFPDFTFNIKNFEPEGEIN